MSSQRLVALFATVRTMRQMAIDTRSGEELFALLSTREREVLERIARGLTNAQVAGELKVDRLSALVCRIETEKRRVRFV